MDLSVSGWVVPGLSGCYQPFFSSPKRSVESPSSNDWRCSLEKWSTLAGLVGLSGTLPLLTRRFMPLVLSSRLSVAFTALSLAGMAGGGFSTLGHTILYGDKIASGEGSWQNMVHAGASCLGFASIATGGLFLLQAVSPPPIIFLLTLASFLADVVELGAYYSEIGEEGPKSSWEWGLQAALVLGLNLSGRNRFEVRRGFQYIFNREKVVLSSDDVLQQAVYRKGGEIIAHAQTYSPTLQERLVKAVVDLSLRDDGLRSNLLRFTCALPQVQDNPHEVMRLAREFFKPVAHKFPFLMRPLVRMGLSETIAFDIFEKALSRAIQMGPEVMSSHFLGGVNSEQLAKIIQRLERNKIDVTVDNLGEFTTSEAAADLYCERTLRMMQVLKKGSSCSMKLTGLTPSFDPDAPDYVMSKDNSLYRRFRLVLDAAHRKELIAFVDAEHQVTNPLMYEYQKRMYDEMLAEKDYRKGGFVIQCYGRRSREWLREICEWAKARGDRLGDDKQNCVVRLVKGAYHEAEAQKEWDIPVFTRQEETDTNYRKAIDELFAYHEYITPCVATHNVRDAAYAIVKAEEMGILHKIEIQCLFGMSDNLKYALAQMGIKIRAYVPHMTQKVDGKTTDISDLVKEVSFLTNPRGWLETKFPFLRTPSPTDGDPQQGIAYLARRLIENGSAASRKNQITWDTNVREVLTLNDVSLS